MYDDEYTRLAYMYDDEYVVEGQAHHVTIEDGVPTLTVIEFLAE